MNAGCVNGLGNDRPASGGERKSLGGNWSSHCDIGKVEAGLYHPMHPKLYRDGK